MKTPANSSARFDLSPGSRAVVKFTPDRSGTLFEIPRVGISKLPGFTYEVKADGGTVYGEGPLPPTDVDDLVEAFDPPLQFRDSLRVIVRNTGANTRTVEVKVAGREVDG